LATMHGLNKFDGKRFENYTEKDGLNSNVITSLLEVKEKIFIGNLEKGINVLRAGKIESFRSTINGISFNTTDLLEYQGSIYGYMSTGAVFATSHENSSTDNGRVISSFPLFINRLAQLTDGSLIALTSKGVYFFNGNTYSKINIHGLPDENVVSFAMDVDGSYLIGSKDLIYRIENNKVIHRYHVNLAGNTNVFNLLVDSNKNIWFSLLGRGFYLIPSGSEKIINMGIKLELENTQVNGFLEDNERNIWITTFGKGVYCLNNLYIRNYTEHDGLLNNNINCIVKEKSGRILIGTFNGINILENGVFKSLNYKSGEAVMGYINNIICGRDNIYVSLTSHEAKFKSVQYKDLTFRFLQYQAICKTSYGFYLIGSITNSILVENNLNSKPANSPRFFVFGDSTNINRINTIIEDSRKNIWAGTSSGVCKINIPNGSINFNSWEKTFFPGDPVLSAKINYIFEDENEKIWFTGVKGIACFDLKNNKLTSYTNLLGYDLSSSTSIAVDKKGRLWIGNMKGLFVFDGLTVKYFDNRNGLISREVLALCYDDASNLLYIGTNGGISVMDINLFDQRVYPPLEVKIISVKAGGSVYNAYDNLIFEPEQNDILVSFTSLKYSSPGSVKYRYNLGGKWEETGNDFLDFTSLKSGHYRLELMSKSTNNYWGRPAILKFEIKPSFYETIWFFALIIAVSTMVSISVFSWRYRIKNKKLQSELKVAEKINELEHQALSAMMNPHFIFNSLNSIQYLVNFNRLEEANDYIAMLAKLIRLNLNTSNNEFIILTEEISRLKLYLDLEKLRLQDSFDYEIIVGEDVDIQATMIPNMIIQPFVENSIWHGLVNIAEGGKLKISFSLEVYNADPVQGRSLIVRITDNGIGIINSKKDKNGDHISRGIEIVEKRLKLLTAKINVPKSIIIEDLSSRGGHSHGTEVIISLVKPLYKIY